VVEYGNENSTCWECIGWKAEVSSNDKKLINGNNKYGIHGISKSELNHHPQISACEKMQRDVTHHAMSATGYCQTTFIINQTGDSIADDDFLEIHRSPAYIIDDLKVNTTGVTCESTRYEKGDASITAKILKCIETCRGRDCNNSTIPRSHMLLEFNKNKCYTQNCGTPDSKTDIDDCDLSKATNDTGHGVCKTITTYDSADDLTSIQRLTTSESDPIAPTFGYKCSTNSGKTVCEQNCMGDLCNQYTLSMHAICITCESMFPSIDFFDCLQANQHSTNLVKICPNDLSYCVTRQAFDMNNQTIAVQKGCSHNQTEDFYTGHVIPFKRECWYITDNPENNATYVCSQKYQGRSDQPTNTKILSLGNFQVNPTTPSGGSRVIMALTRLLSIFVLIERISLFLT